MRKCAEEKEWSDKMEIDVTIWKEADTIWTVIANERDVKISQRVFDREMLKCLFADADVNGDPYVLPVGDDKTLWGCCRDSSNGQIYFARVRKV